NRTKDLLARQSMLRSDARKNAWTDEPRFSFSPAACGGFHCKLQPPLPLPNLDILPDLPRSFFIDHRSNICRRVQRITHNQRTRRFHQPLEEKIVNLFQNDCAAARRALLSGVRECR